MNNTTLPNGTRIEVIGGKKGTIVGFDNERGALSSGQYIVRLDGTDKNRLVSVRAVKTL
jgi:hypothetical protein